MITRGFFQPRAEFNPRVEISSRLQLQMKFQPWVELSLRLKFFPCNCLNPGLKPNAVGAYMVVSKVELEIFSLVNRAAFNPGVVIFHVIERNFQSTRLSSTPGLKMPHVVRPLIVYNHKGPTHHKGFGNAV